MSHKNNNDNKDTDIKVSPEVIEQCFYSIETDFQDFEKKFILFHLRSRTNFKLRNEYSLRPFGIKFLYWFLKNIHSELGPAGSGLCQCLMVKLNMGKDNGNWWQFGSKQIFAFDRSVRNLYEQ